jgi:hypothetical protein
MMEQPEQPKVEVEQGRQDPMFPDLSKCSVCGANAIFTVGKWGKWLAGYCTYHFFEKAASMVKALAKENGWNFEGYEGVDDPEEHGRQEGSLGP